MLGMMGSDFNFGHSIPNAAMLSPARHPMWLHCLDSVRERLQEAFDKGVRLEVGTLCRNRNPW